MREASIKIALQKHFLSKKPQCEQAALLSEVKLNGGLARADLVNAHEMHCYEIKSDGDNLKRLLHQGSHYIRVFEKVTLVTSKKHLRKAVEILPSWWGVMVIPDTPEQDFKELRTAHRNSYQDTLQLVRLLTKNECIELLEAEEPGKGKSSLALYRLQDYIVSKIPENNIKRFVKLALIKRAEDRPLQCR